MFIHYTIGVVLCGAAIMGFTSGVLGAFAFLRQQSLLGDAIAHASLPGLAAMFLLTHTKSPSILMIGGACAGMLGVMFMHVLMHRTRLKKDAILGIILSVFFGVGLVLLTMAQKYPISNQSILNKFLFGSASTLLAHDVLVMGCMAAFVLACVVLWWKEFLFITFDRASAQALGYAVHRYELFLSFLLVITIVIGLQTVGVVLMSSMLIAPAAAARQWVAHVYSMVLVSGCLGAYHAVGGVIISSGIPHVPTGPSIVIVASGVVIISLLCAPHRGLLYRLWSKRRGAL